MYEVSVRCDFSAAHKLRGYRGKCENLHGHNWQVEAVVSSVGLNAIGVVMDFKKLKLYLEDILKKLDHSYINMLAYFKRNNPTSEYLAKFIYIQLKKKIKDGKICIKRITVWESQNCCASYYEQNG